MPRGGVITHGQSASGRRTPEFAAWLNMRARCNAPSASGYANYGGRGIRVCPEWAESFQAFLAHVGLRPSGAHSLDRIDVNGNYEPGNVRWATASQQNSNRRKFTHKRLKETTHG